MTFGEGLGLVAREVAAFIRQLWWLALLLAVPDLLIFFLPFLLMDSAFWDEGADWLLVRSITLPLLPLLIHLAVFYVMMRFMVLGHDRRSALRVDRQSFATFRPFAIAWLAWSIASNLAGSAFGYSDVWGLIEGLLFMLLALWAVPAPGGGAVISPGQSVQAISAAPVFAWALLFSLVTNGGVSLFFGVPSWSFIQLGPPGTPWLEAIMLLWQMARSVIGWLVYFATLYVIALRAGLRTAPLAEADEQG